MFAHLAEKTVPMLATLLASIDPLIWRTGDEKLVLATKYTY